MLISAPGRTEVGGNHTDHQHGCVLAAAVNLEVRLAVEKQAGSRVEVETDKFGKISLDISTLNPNLNDNDSAALIRGVAAFLEKQGYITGAFTGTLTSEVLVGSGLSSSAAFENAIAGAFSHLYNDGKIPLTVIARAGQYAENVYLNKGSGLMDQTASAFGGFTQIDFNDPTNPIISPINFDFRNSGFALCITDTKGSHANLTNAYSSMPNEMKMIANYFGKDVLNEVDENEFYSNLKAVREKTSDRAVLRAGHFFAETKRAVMEAEALKWGDFDKFLSIVQESGNSSLAYLQNVWNSPDQQGVTLGLLVSQRVLQNPGKEPVGAWRVHGGGLAGTIQAFVPLDLVSKYQQQLDDLFGEGSCQLLQIRKEGMVRID